VTGGGASDGDMPIFPWPAPSDVPSVGDAAFDALLAGELLPESAPGGLRPVAEAIAALSGPPLASELAGEARVLAAFRGEIGRSREPVRSGRRRHPVLAWLLSARIAAAAAAGAVVLSGAAAAAYADVLPAPAQNLAHDMIGAPRVRPAAQPATPAAPAVAARRAAYGLCTAYAHVRTHGRAGQKAAAFRKLAAAAGGTANVTAYCAAAHPGAKPGGKPASHPGGKPASNAGGKPTSHPGGKPASNPGGKPTSHPGGKPASHPGGKPPGTP
jgi:hypothetical protein